MNRAPECVVVIPCLNEAAMIGALVADVRRLVSTVFVVDDGSTDGTGKLAEQAGAQVLRHAKPLGKGAALQTGWRHAREHGFKWALTMDGDGQHSPADIPAFLNCAEKTSADLVVGNRMDATEKMPRLRRFVNRWMSARISKQAGRPLPDSQCGFRLIKLDALSATLITTVHFEIESEVLLAFARAGRNIEFVPVQVIYKSEQSKIHPLRDTVRWFRWWQQTRRERKFQIPSSRQASIIKQRHQSSRSSHPAVRHALNRNATVGVKPARTPALSPGSGRNSGPLSNNP